MCCLLSFCPFCFSATSHLPYVRKVFRCLFAGQIDNQPRSTCTWTYLSCRFSVHHHHLRSERKKEGARSMTASIQPVEGFSIISTTTYHAMQSVTVLLRTLLSTNGKCRSRDNGSPLTNTHLPYARTRKYLRASQYPLLCLDFNRRNGGLFGCSSNCLLAYSQHYEATYNHTNHPPLFHISPSRSDALNDYFSFLSTFLSKRKERKKAKKRKKQRGAKTVSDQK